MSQAHRSENLKTCNKMSELTTRRHIRWVEVQLHQFSPSA